MTKCRLTAINLSTRNPYHRRKPTLFRHSHRKPHKAVVFTLSTRVSTGPVSGRSGELSTILGESTPRGRRPKARNRVLAAYISEIEAGGAVPTLARLARRAGLYDYRDARRHLRQLRRLGALA
jgi:hypothetical protein